MDKLRLDPPTFPVMTAALVNFHFELASFSGSWRHAVFELCTRCLYQHMRIELLFHVVFFNMLTRGTVRSDNITPERF